MVDLVSSTSVKDPSVLFRWHPVLGHRDVRDAVQPRFDEGNYRVADVDGTSLHAVGYPLDHRTVDCEREELDGHGHGRFVVGREIGVFLEEQHHGFAIDRIQVIYQLTLVLGAVDLDGERSQFLERLHPFEHHPYQGWGAVFGRYGQFGLYAEAIYTEDVLEMIVECLTRYVRLIGDLAYGYLVEGTGLEEIIDGFPDQLFRDFRVHISGQ